MLVVVQVRSTSNLGGDKASLLRARRIERRAVFLSVAQLKGENVRACWAFTCWSDDVLLKMTKV